MNNHIFKYTIPITDGLIELKIPLDHEFCDIQVQGNDLVMWLFIDSHGQFIKKKFKIFGTGEYIHDPDDYFYLKTVQMPNGLVWHIFEANE